VQAAPDAPAARAGSGARGLPPPGPAPAPPAPPAPLPPSGRPGAASLDEEEDYVMIDGPSPFSSGQHLRHGARRRPALH